MLHEFLTANRIELITRCRGKAARRFESSEIPAIIDHGVSLFLQQLANTLRFEQSTAEPEAAEPEAAPAASDIGRAAALHGAELLRLGYRIDQVVHEYGDVCQAITELAVEQDALIETDEFRTLNRCLDNAIADAVTSFGTARQVAANGQAETLHLRLNSFTLEHQRLVRIAIQAYSAIETGTIGLGGATGRLLTHALSELRTLPERAMPEIRLATAPLAAAAE